ncbi:hypothetical protein PHLGIDRAFT_208843 [Phlebiopsis gigantea 11061_1 CR5-6]|uniref:F-box domain-containing protein n=1 Tax=Phlebiopsis gigantea (strain 11061_1 CR5-6) TaxID=745531 RepID=A0A0C3S4H0_PHLG1|nr:hypothetical protein PHLGIDRAFT_208843 [Phlebiopsis gigantea 11061_1 CR5-6]
MAPSFIHGTLKKLDLGLTRLSTRNAKAIQHGEPLLPTIACELVIDFVARERPTEKVWENDALKTLRACSLTCRAWRLRSQYHLFRFLVVKCTQKHMKGIIALLDRHPALCSRIELLVIKPRAVGDSLTDNIPPRITQRLGSVPEIRLSSCYIAPGSRIDSYLQQFTAITTLNLFYVEFKTFEDMRRITMLFHNLTSLTINATKWRGYPDAQPSSIVLPVKLRLRELYIAGSAKWMQDRRANALFEWLAQSGILSGLEILKLQNLMILTDASCASVRGVVEAALSTLTMVSFSPGPELDYTICE